MHFYVFSQCIVAYLLVCLNVYLDHKVIFESQLLNAYTCASVQHAFGVEASHMIQQIIHFRNSWILIVCSSCCFMTDNI